MRIGAALDMVKEVPPPPVVVSSCGMREETAMWISFWNVVRNWRDRGSYSQSFLLFR